MRYLTYLFASLVMQLVALVITPVLPLFAVLRDGWSDNHSVRVIEPRLPSRLAWFDTPDNSLLGDANFLRSHGVGYWSQVAWLYRNSLYGFKWGPLACEVDPVLLSCSGDPKVNRNNGITGLFRASYPGGYWQWKLVSNSVSAWSFWLAAIVVVALSFYAIGDSWVFWPIQVLTAWLVYGAISIHSGKGVMWNFGWQLDEFVPANIHTKGIALFQFSPRFVRIK